MNHPPPTSDVGWMVRKATQCELPSHTDVTRDNVSYDVTLLRISNSEFRISFHAGYKSRPKPPPTSHCGTHKFHVTIYVSLIIRREEIHPSTNYTHTHTHTKYHNNTMKTTLPQPLLYLLLTSSITAYNTETNNAALMSVTDGSSAAGLHALFDDWKAKFEREYSSLEEMLRRRAIWLENHVRILEHNSIAEGSGELTFTLGHNQFSDMTFEEFKQFVRIGEFAAPMRTKTLSRASDSENSKDKVEDVSAEAVENIQQNGELDADAAVMRKLRTGESSSSSSDVEQTEEDSKEQAEEVDTNNAELPEYVNWVEQGAVASVKNQGMCGSCWAFSAVGAIEGGFAIKTGELVEFSEQQLVDCDTKGDEPDMGCNGGLMDNAFIFEKSENGLCTLNDYPYAGQQQTCADTSCENVAGSGVSGFVDVQESSNQAMKEALSMHPVSIAIQADQLAFQFYRSGVFNSRCGTDLDHGVLAVGYGTDENGGDYWLVKNSWGTMWGEDGYIKLARDDSVDDAGKCGILLMGSYPTF